MKESQMKFRVALIFIVLLLINCWELGHINQHDIQSPTPEEMIGWVNYPEIHAVRIAEGLQGTIWVVGFIHHYQSGTFTYPLYKFDGAKWIEISKEEIGIKDTIVVTALYNDRMGNVYVGLRNNGLAVYNGSFWKIYNQNSGLVSNQISCIMVEPNNNLWIGTDAGLMRYSGIKWDTFTIINGLPNDTIYDVEVCKNGKILALTAGGFCLYENNQWTKNFPQPEAIYYSIYQIVQDREGFLWITKFDWSTAPPASKYFSRFDGTNWKDFDFGLCSREFVFDQNNDLWILPGHGVAYYKDKECKYFYSYSSGIYNYPEGNSGLLDNVINCIFVDNDNNKWFGTIKGISKYELGG